MPFSALSVAVLGDLRGLSLRFPAAWPKTLKRRGRAETRRVRGRRTSRGLSSVCVSHRLARANTLNGWVLNGEEGAEIYLESEPVFAGIGCPEPDSCLLAR